MAKNKRKRSLSTNARIIICLILLLAAAALYWMGMQDFKTMVDLKNSITENTEKSKELDEKKEDLEETKQNLKNPDYLEQLARNKYLVTKEGEQVFKFPSDEQDK